ncbi:sulfotransferase family protein [Roseobacter sp.]|uniref:sulfotransferase family protein n=1 Tax=Roseobacter sp. TaxID=1907202 RepID=UPI00329681E4
MIALRDGVKTLAAGTVARAVPQCRFDRCLFVLAHMRCGSTALSNILCSRPDISGYGEAHIRYGAPNALGGLVVNQARRGGWSPRADYLFDKVLHSRHDSAAPPEFFRSRAIFVLRAPEPTIVSIHRLYQKLGRDEYGTHQLAAEYYISRVTALSQLWDRFAPDHRFGVTHETLITEPDATLAGLSTWLDLSPPLLNQYQSKAASRRGGAGDPLQSGAFSRIERGAISDLSGVTLEIDDAQRAAALAAYEMFRDKLNTAAHPVTRADTSTPPE